MKKIIMFSVLLLILLALSSCGVYEKQCPGVGQKSISEFSA
jgi:thiol:disulfide interchange protein